MRLKNYDVSEVLSNEKAPYIINDVAVLCNNIGCKSIRYIVPYCKNMEDLLEDARDDDVVIVSLAYASTHDYPKDKYYCDISNPCDIDDSKEWFDINEAVSRTSSILEKLSFKNVNRYCQFFDYIIPYVWTGNSCGAKIVEAMEDKLAVDNDDFSVRDEISDDIWKIS